LYLPDGQSPKNAKYMILRRNRLIPVDDYSPIKEKYRKLPIYDLVPA
jgi:hypothetical protein